MKLKIYVAVAGMVLVFFHPVFAAMGSSNFAITTSVMSGGGVPMSSANFATHSTLGQSSPIKATSSTSYALYSGFWYTMVQSCCIWDLDPDGDVDGFDLYQFIHPSYNASDIESFGEEFGRTDCSN